MRKVLYILCYNIAIEQDLEDKAAGWIYNLGENGEATNSTYSPLGFIHALKHLEECVDCKMLNLSIKEST